MRVYAEVYAGLTRRSTQGLRGVYAYDTFYCFKREAEVVYAGSTRGLRALIILSQQNDNSKPHAYLVPHN
eukprot:3054990-Heterocapsa_arctica.AAC.1